ncbi:MAG: TetR/AcrR family transcriptional regulator, partial [Alloprevotella sp.]|nr:TetR/AcrR family transcriptional regulator [Alloprevotella sp.]
MQTLKDHTRRTIMDVARSAFLQDGFLKASMRGVATATGTSLGNLYNYFPSKDALFVAVVEPFTAQMERLLESYHALTGYDMLEWNAPENIQKTTETYLSLVREHRDLMCLLF